MLIGIAYSQNAVSILSMQGESVPDDSVAMTGPPLSRPDTTASDTTLAGLAARDTTARDTGGRDSISRIDRSKVDIESAVTFSAADSLVLVGLNKASMATAPSNIRTSSSTRPRSAWTSTAAPSTPPA